MDKLTDLRSAAAKEGFEIHVPDNLNCVDRVGTFQKLVERSEMDSDLKSKVGSKVQKRGTDDHGGMGDGRAKQKKDRRAKKGGIQAETCGIV